MGIRLINYVNNQQSSPALYTGIFSTRPPAGIGGRLFMSIDTQEIYQDLTTSWQLLADAGSGSGSLESVTANGNSTTYGMTVLANNFSLTNASSNFNYKAITTGSILFSADSSGLISQNNANFFWDNTNNRLGLGTAAPSARLDVHSSSGTSAILNGTAASNALLTFQNTGVSKWSVGNAVSSTVANDFLIYDNVNTTPRLLVHNTGVVNIPTTLIIGTTTPTSSFTFDVTGSGKFSSTLTLGTMTAGSVLFAGASGVISQNNSKFFWDNTNNRLGIGIATPTYQLDVLNGIGRFYCPTTTNQSGLIIQATAAGAGGSQAGVLYNNNLGTSRFSAYLETSTDTYIIGDSVSTSFLTIVRSTGNLLINSSTDNGHKLQVTGQIDSLGAGSAVLWQDTGAGVNWTFYAAGSVFRFSNTAAGIVANISQTTGVYTPTSDINKKKDFELSTIGLDSILGLKPTLFRMKTENNTNKHLGFIAQEVKEFIPQAYVENDGFIGLSDRPIIAALVKSIQELNEKLIRNNIN
jgi:hypothetical protein